MSTNIEQKNGERPASVTVGIGAFDTPDENGRRAVLRAWYLRMVAREVPDVLQGLYKNGVKLYRDLERESPHVTFDDILCPAEPLPKAARRLRSHLYQWAETWNLSADWCLESALWTLRLFSHFPKRPTALTWSLGPLAVFFVPRDCPPSDGLPVYDPLSATRKVYLETLRKAVEDTMDPVLKQHGDSSFQKAFIDTVINKANDYCIAVERHVESLGYERSDQKREIEKHLRWAVKFQVQGIPYSAIALSSLRAKDFIETPTQPSTVMRGVKDVLQIIDLTPRADAKPGRPKQSD